MYRPEKAEPKAYGETKKPKQFMITEWASERLDLMADELGISRSEVLERLIRSGGLEAAKQYRSPEIAQGTEKSLLTKKR